MIYRNSGSFGDLIYSLVVAKKLGPGEFQIPIGNLANACRKHHRFNILDLQPIHRDYFTEQHFDLLKPLLEIQPYITDVTKWYPDNHRLHTDTDYFVDLDKFRSYMWHEYRGNYLEMFYSLFDIPYTPEDLVKPWLVADKIEVAPLVVARTERYRSPHAGRANQKKLAMDFEFHKNAIFVGSEKEHADYEQEINIKIPHYKVKDFKELADVINGANLLIANQTFALSLAVGLGKDAIIETRPVPMHHNECYFPFRKNISYF